MEAAEPWLLEQLDGLDVALGEVLDVDVVPHARAVRCRVVVAEYLQLTEATHSDLR